MINKPNVQIVVCRCGCTKNLFGIRAEEVKRNEWEINWAFQISDKRAQSENYDSSKIDGSFNLTSNYPGCPYCGSGSFFSCGTCGKLTCWDGNAKKVTCAHCNNISNIEGVISQLSTGGDI